MGIKGMFLFNETYKIFLLTYKNISFDTLSY
jgi:hypothetical protein